jgi:hypothetical protein
MNLTKFLLRYVNLPFNNLYFGPATQANLANAPALPFDLFQIGRYQYQSDGEWRALDWNGKDWVPGSGELAQGELRNAIDLDRQKILDMNKAARSVAEEGVRKALPLTSEFGFSKPIPLDINDGFRSARAWTAPATP